MLFGKVQGGSFLLRFPGPRDFQVFSSGDWGPRGAKVGAKYQFI